MSVGAGSRSSSKASVFVGFVRVFAGADVPDIFPPPAPEVVAGALLSFTRGSTNSREYVEE